MTEQEQIAYHAARRVWKKPGRTSKGLTWQNWWTDKFKEDYFEYTDRKRRESVSKVSTDV